MWYFLFLLVSTSLASELTNTNMTNSFLREADVCIMKECRYECMEIEKPNSTIA